MDIYIFDMYNDLKEQENMRATPITRIQLFSNKYMDMHIFDMYNDLTEQEKIRATPTLRIQLFSNTCMDIYVHRHHKFSYFQINVWLYTYSISILN